MGSGNQKRQHATAMRAYALSQEGETHRRIADLLEKPVENIPKWIALGERLTSGKSAESAK